MKYTTDVYFEDTSSGLKEAVRGSIDYYNKKKPLIKASGDVYIKVNAVDLKKYSYTDPEVIWHTIEAFKDLGARNIYVIENCTQGNFTRLVFHATGISKICRETGAIPVYLDETDAVPVYLEGLQSFIDISSFVYENLIEKRDENLYVSLPKLKTHSMSQVTLSIKNQFGLVHQASRIADHNFKIHQKFADIYRIIRPDFVLIDGLIATNHGHYVAEANVEECIIKTDCLISGTDPMAVDTIAASFLGYSLNRVEHLKLAAKTGIGESRLKNIKIVNPKIFESRKMKLTHELLDRFPPELTILRGKERCCPEGCRRNTETVVEVLFCDHGGKGDFTILMGKGIVKKDVDAITGPVHIAGSCAIQEYGLSLVKRLGKKKVTMSHGCNNLRETIMGLCEHMKVNPLGLTGTGPLTSLKLLLEARAHKTKALIPPPL